VSDAELPHASPLQESDVDPDPIAQFAAWFEDARAVGIRLPEAMVLATASTDGAPSARFVLLNRFDERGFIFFGNYESRKGRELAENPRAALVFHWDPLGRQVRIEGPVERLSAEESDSYFATRPRGARLSALAARQSEVVESREALETRVAERSAEFPDDAVPRPPHWGGYRLTPEAIELWQHREDRLHDRLRYRRSGDGRWAIERLAP
jgi:pyridoxamine 5'-phosphate oxidase